MAAQPKTGTVVFKDGTYFLEAEGKLHAIPIGAKIQPTQLRELVGKQVEVLHSEPKSFIVGLVLAGTRPGRIPVLCYFPPAPFDLGVVEDSARVGLAKQFLAEGVLSQETFNKLAGGSE